jgi:hypothetical protein
VGQRHADLFEVGFDQPRVDLVLAEHGFVLSEGQSRLATGRRSSSLPHTVRF